MKPTTEYKCPYCSSKNKAVRETYYDMMCQGCMSRINADIRKGCYLVEHGGRGNQKSLFSVIRGLFTRKSNKNGV